ncbi:MAG: ATP-binding cassette domain-containing protein [Treponema sp.]|jgi:energy-coupling factor transport system ATP-binding protein|nr:ATP-binding cassette domain-containing protein [Treponema sp.]
MISLENLRFRYRGGLRDALAGISLEIPDGEFLGIIGPSGAGKSTLAYALNGVVPHHYGGDFYGRALVNGLDTVDAGTERIAAELGSVFQDIDGQMVASVVEDEILFGLENFRVPRDEIEDRLKAALGMAGIEDLRYRALSTLSGGQKQKVAIAAITALRPRIIVLDEATGELDPVSSRQVFEFLRDLNRRFGITIIAVEQKIMLLCEFARRLAVMDKGSLVLHGTVTEVLQRPELLEGCGINIPRVTSLGKALRDRGFYAGPLPHSLDQAGAMMKNLFSEYGNAAF